MFVVNIVIFMGLPAPNAANLRAVAEFDTDAVLVAWEYGIGDF